MAIHVHRPFFLLFFLLIFFENRYSLILRDFLITKISVAIDNSFPLQGHSPKKSSIVKIGPNLKPQNTIIFCF